MRLWGRKRQTFDAPAPAARFGVDVPPELLEALSPSNLDRRVQRREALSVPAVLRGRNLICSTLAGLPWEIIGPKRERVDGYLLGGNIDPDVPNIVTIASTLEDLIFEGIAWWRVTKFGWHNFPIEARLVPPESVHVSGTPSLPSQSQILPDHPNVIDGQVFIDGVPVPDNEILRFDSPNPPLLVYAARAIRSALLLDQRAARASEENLPIGYFTPGENAEPLSTEPSSANDGTERSEVEALLDEWAESRRRRAWGYIGGLKAETLEWDPKKLQLAESRQHAVLEISRAMGIDPEDLGVSTTSRTYANREQRNQHLLDFTLSAYVGAFEQRLSMRDIVPRGYRARGNFSGFLRTDTPTRMQTYKTGLEVGAYADKDEVREAEDKPPLTPAQRRAQPAPQPVEPQQEGSEMESDTESARFTDETDHTIVTFDDAEVAETFRVNPEKRTISGLTVPWGKIARSGFAKWRFVEGSLHWSSEARIKLNMEHDRGQIVGKAIRLQSTSRGLDATFKVGRGEDGDRALEKAEDGLLDGFSIEVDFDEDAGDDWQPDPTDESVRLVRSGTLRGTALTGNPAFDDARVSRVAASRDNNGRKGTMPEDTKQGEPSGTEFDFAGYADKLGEVVAESHKSLTESLGESIGESISTGVKAALENITDPQGGPEPVRAARFTVTREAPVYSFNGLGDSLVRDAWYAAREHDDDAIDRLRKYRKQSEEVAKLAKQYVASQAFAAETRAGNPQIIPPGYRPDLYLPELGQGRPLVGLCSQGTIGNATPFVVPTFGSATGASADHVEGTNPTDGNLAFGSETVTPGAISGRLTLTREIVDSSNPAIDQIALAAMRESYNQQTEAKVFAALNGTATTTVTYAAASVITDVRDLLAQYPFVRFAAPTGAAMNQKVTRAFATAEDSTGRPLLPSVGAQNTAGLGNAVNQGWFIDGLTFVPAWSITDALSDDVGLVVNRSDVWCWESPLLTFRYEEKQGPANIEMNVFGYFATHVLRAAGVFAVRNPAA